MAGITDSLALVFGLIAALSFVYIDAFATKFVDNILNTLIPGLLLMLGIVLFI